MLTAKDGVAVPEHLAWLDWLEGQLSEHADLAVRYGLIAVTSPVPHDGASNSASRAKLRPGAR